VVLPVNWRSNLSFEDGGPMKEGDKDHGDFSLRDITPASIPAVRSLISDVMLDIPFYSRYFFASQSFTLASSRRKLLYARGWTSPIL